jgi:hypothetical protein
MAIKYTNIYHWKTLQNLPKLGFWVLESVIEQQKVSEFLIFASRKKTVARNLQMCMTLKPPTL